MEEFNSEERLRRIETVIIKLREVCIILLGCIEDEYNIPRTKKRSDRKEKEHERNEESKPI